MTWPPAPTPNIDWSSIGFNVKDLNGHAESTFSKKTGTWSEPEFVQDPYLKIHGLAPGLNYGQQAYEGMKAYRAPDDSILLFRPMRHAIRMSHSASFVSIPEIPEAHFLACVNLAVSQNAEYVPPHGSGALLYIRPVVFGSGPQVALGPPETYTFCVYVQPTNDYHGASSLDALIMETFDRCAPRGTGSAKVGGNYAPVLRHAGKAKMMGYPLTLHLDSQTRTEVEEFSTCGFVGIKDESETGDVTIIVPDSQNVIQSVTSECVLEVAAAWGWNVEKRVIKYEELAELTEVLAVGTAASLLPVKSITCLSKGDKFLYGGTGADEKRQSVCQKLATVIRDVQMGKEQDVFGWCQKVEETSLFASSEGTKGRWTAVSMGCPGDIKSIA